MPRPPLFCAFDFTTGDVHYIGETPSDTKGWVYDEIFTSNSISLEAVTGNSPSRIYADNNRGNCFVIYKDGLLTVRAPQGMAVTKVEFEMAGNSNIKKFSSSSGSISDLTWNGNAEGVRFTQGATSYLASIAVTIAGNDGNTVTLPAFEYADCQNIAALNALADGQRARVRISDAQVIGKSSDGVTTAWIQDATGGAAVRYSSIVDKLYKIEDTWVKDETKMDDVTILAILSAKDTTTNQLLPLSMTSGSATGITSVKTSTPMESIYNLMGVRISQLKRGINIVNGQKVMVK